MLREPPSCAQAQALTAKKLGRLRQLGRGLPALTPRPGNTSSSLSSSGKTGEPCHHDGGEGEPGTVAAGEHALSNPIDPVSGIGESNSGTVEVGERWMSDRATSGALCGRGSWRQALVLRGGVDCGGERVRRDIAQWIGEETC